MEWSAKDMGWRPKHGEMYMAGRTMDVPYVPMPLVGMAMVLGLVLGMTIGSMKARKHDMMWMAGNQGWSHGGHGHRMGMKAHHHHGDGGPMCCEAHDTWPTAEDRETLD